MNRRPFLKAAAATILGIFGAGAVAKADGERPDDLARVFRKSPNGKFLEIDRHDVKKGDELFLIGLDNRELYSLSSFKADSDFYEDGSKYGATECRESCDLLHRATTGYGGPAIRVD